MRAYASANENKQLINDSWLLLQAGELILGRNGCKKKKQSESVKRGEAKQVLRNLA
jgi:hypothetical protein